MGLVSRRHSLELGLLALRLARTRLWAAAGIPRGCYRVLSSRCHSGGGDFFVSSPTRSKAAAILNPQSFATSSVLCP